MDINLHVRPEDNGSERSPDPVALPSPPRGGRAGLVASAQLGGQGASGLDGAAHSQGDGGELGFFTRPHGGGGEKPRSAAAQ